MWCYKLPKMFFPNRYKNANCRQLSKLKKHREVNKKRSWEICKSRKTYLPYFHEGKLFA